MMMLAKIPYSVVVLTLFMGVAFFTLHAPSKKIANDNESRRKEEGLFGLAIDTSTASLRGRNTKILVMHLLQDFRKLEEQTPAVYPQLLEPTSNPPTSSPASTSMFPSSYTRNIDALGLIAYQSDQKYTVSLHVFLPDTSMLMDEESRQSFELAALTFIINRVNQIEVPIKVIGNTNVVDQRLTWSRLVDGKSTTGVEVYFEVDSTVPEDVKKSECEEALQVLFDLQAKAFQKVLNLALYGERPEELEPPTTTFSLEPVRKPLGLGLTAVGCISFIGIMVLSARHVNKNEQEAKDLSKTSIVDDNDNETRGQLNFPVQQAIIGQQNWDSSSDESDAVLTFDDNSFNNSLIFCPSIVKEKTDLGTLFEDQSAIANINSLTDSDEDDGVYQYSPIRPGPKKQLTNTDLNDFDVGLRMAEC